MPIQNRLAALRQSRGVSAAALAARAGVTRQTIYAIEAGSYVPNTVVALRLAREFEVAVEDLFSLDETPPRQRETIEAEILTRSPVDEDAAVRVAKVGGNWICTPVEPVPVYLTPADGTIKRTRKSGRAAVHLSDPVESVERRLVIAGCDPGIGLLSSLAERSSGVEVVTVPASSRRALQWLKQGKIHVAGSHLEDAASGDFNVPQIRRLMPDEDVTVVTFARWQEGFVVARKNPLGIRTAADLAARNVRIVNREPGAGSRLLLDELLRTAGLPAAGVRGYETLAAGHLDAARWVASGLADCCVATASAARAFGLDFVPLREERFDLAVRRECLQLPAVRGLLDTLQLAALRRKLQDLAGYDTSGTGSVVWG
jgi:putative molybdopterin biosynthesis protein